ncbi:hypothetical protein Q1695_002827 [Nippostrongylus brasiliensis]|nr:hypothetical protein Q1695_002827 [Nippostrongylus brasiliensis]
MMQDFEKEYDHDIYYFCDSCTSLLAGRVGVCENVQCSLIRVDVDRASVFSDRRKLKSKELVAQRYLPQNADPEVTCQIKRTVGVLREEIEIAHKRQRLADD